MMHDWVQVDQGVLIAFFCSGLLQLQQGLFRFLTYRHLLIGIAYFWNMTLSLFVFD